MGLNKVKDKGRMSNFLVSSVLYIYIFGKDDIIPRELIKIVQTLTK